MRTAKAWLAAAGTVLMAVTAVLTDNVININEVGTLVTVAIEAALTIWAVYKVPNAGFVEKPHGE